MERKVLMGNDVKLENIEEQVHLSGKKLEELIGLIKNLKNSNIDADSLDSDILRQIEKRLESLSVQNNDDFTESLLQELKRNFDEKQKFMKSKLNNIEEISQKLFEYINNLSDTENDSLKKVEYIQNSVSLFSSDIEDLKNVFSNIEDQLIAFVNDNTKEKAISKLIDKLKDDFERFNHGFELLISNMNEKFKTLSKLVNSMDQNDELAEIKKEIDSIEMSVNTVISAVSMIDFKYKDIQESLATLTKAEDAEGSRRDIALILEKSMLMNQILESVAQKDDIKGIESNISTVNALIVELKNILTNTQSENARLSKENLDTIAEKLDNLKVSLSEHKTNSLDVDEKFQEFYQKTESLSQMLQKLMAMDTAQLLQKDMEVLSQKLETILISIKNTADKNTAAHVKDTANNLSMVLTELKNDFDNNFSTKIDNLVESFVSFDKKSDNIVSILNDDKVITEINKKISNLNENLENVKASLSRLDVLDEVDDIKYAVESLVNETDWSQFKEDLNLILNKISTENDTFRGEVYDLKNNVEDITGVLSQGLFKKDFDAFYQEFNTFKDDVLTNYDRCVELFNRLSTKNSEQLAENFTEFKADIQENILQHKTEVIDKIIEHSSSEAFENVLRTLNENRKNVDNKLNELKDDVFATKDEIINKIGENNGGAENIGQIIADNINVLKEDYRNGISDIIENIRNQAGEVTDIDIENKLNEIETSLKEEISGNSDRFIDFIQKINNETQERYGELSDYVKGITGNTVTSTENEIETVVSDNSEVLEAINELKALQEEFKSDYQGTLDDISINLEGVVSVEDLQVIIEIVQSKNEEFQEKLISFEGKIADEFGKLEGLNAAGSDEVIKAAITDLKTNLDNSKQEILNSVFSRFKQNEEVLKEGFLSIANALKTPESVNYLDTIKQETSEIKVTLDKHKEALLTLTKINVSEDVQKLFEISHQQLIEQMIQLFENISFVEESEEIKDFIEQSENNLKAELQALKATLGGLNEENSAVDIIKGIDSNVSNLMETVESTDTKVSNILESTASNEEKVLNLLDAVENTDSKLSALDDINTNVAIILENFENADEKLDSLEDINTNIAIILEDFEKNDEKLNVLDALKSDINAVLGGIESHANSIGRTENKIDELNSNVLSGEQRTQTKIDELNSNISNVLGSTQRTEDRINALDEIKSDVSNVLGSAQRTEERLNAVDEIQTNISNALNNIGRTENKIDELNSNVLSGEQRTQTKIDELNSNISNVLGSTQRTEDRINALDEIKSDVSNVLGSAQRTEERLNAVDEIQTNISNALNNIGRTENKIDELNSNVLSGEERTQTKIDELNFNVSNTLNGIGRAENKLDELNSNVLSGTERAQTTIDELKAGVSNVLGSTQRTENRLNTVDEIKSDVSNVLGRTQRIEDQLNSVDELKSNVSNALNGIGKTENKLDELNSNVLNNIERTENRLNTINEIKSDVSNVLGSAQRIEDRLNTVDELKSNVSNALNGIGKTENTIDELNSNVSNVLSSIEKTENSLNTIDENMADVLDNVENTNERLNVIDELQSNVSNILDGVERTENKLNTIDELKSDISNVLGGIERTDAKLNTIDELNSNVSNLVEELGKPDTNEDSINEISSNIINVLDEIKILKGLSEEDEEAGHVYKMTDVESDFARMRLVLDELSKNSSEGSEVNNQIAEEISDITEKMDKILESNNDAEIGHLLDLKSDFQTIINQFSLITNDVTDISNRTNKLILTSDESNNTLKENLAEFKEVISQLDQKSDTTSIKEGITDVSESLENSFKLLDKKLYQLRTEIGKASKISVSNLNSTEIIKDAFFHMAEWIDGAGGVLQEIGDNINELKSVNFEDMREKLQVNYGLKEEIDKVNPTLAEIEKKISEIDRINPALEELDSKVKEIDTLKKEISKILPVLNNFETKFNDLNEKIETINSLQDEIKSVKNDVDKRTKELNRKIDDLSEKFDEQNDKIDSIENKLNKILELQKKKSEEVEIRPILEFIASQASAANENSRENKKLAEKLEQLEHQVNNFDANITKLVSFVDED